MSICRCVSAPASTRAGAGCRCAGRRVPSTPRPCRGFARRAPAVRRPWSRRGRAPSPIAAAFRDRDPGADQIDVGEIGEPVDAVDERLDQLRSRPGWTSDRPSHSSAVAPCSDRRRAAGVERRLGELPVDRGADVGREAPDQRGSGRTTRPRMRARAPPRDQRRDVRGSQAVEPGTLQRIARRVGEPPHGGPNRSPVRGDLFERWRDHDRVVDQVAPGAVGRGGRRLASSALRGVDAAGEPAPGEIEREHHHPRHHEEDHQAGHPAARNRVRRLGLLRAVRWSLRHNLESFRILRQGARPC